MEMYDARRVDALVLESADKAQDLGNQSWELEALRLMAHLRREAVVNAPLSQEQLRGAQRFELKSISGGKGRHGVTATLEFDGNQVPLTRTEASIMNILVPKPNTVVPKERFSAIRIGAKPIADRTLEDTVRRLKQKLGEDAVSVIRGRGLAFLPAHLEQPSQQSR